MDLLLIAAGLLLGNNEVVRVVGELFRKPVVELAARSHQHTTGLTQLGFKRNGISLTRECDHLGELNVAQQGRIGLRHLDHFSAIVPHHAPQDALRRTSWVHPFVVGFLHEHISEALQLLGRREERKERLWSTRLKKQFRTTFEALREERCPVVQIGISKGLIRVCLRQGAHAANNAWKEAMSMSTKAKALTGPNQLEPPVLRCAVLWVADQRNHLEKRICNFGDALLLTLAARTAAGFPTPMFWHLEPQSPVERSGMFVGCALDVLLNARSLHQVLQRIQTDKPTERDAEQPFPVLPSLGWRLSINNPSLLGIRARCSNHERLRGTVRHTLTQSEERTS